MKNIIETENLGKLYRVGETSIGSLRDSFQYWWKHFCNQQVVDSAVPESDFWALKDVSFTVDPGESIGILGKNGVGKSTLLRILSRLTEPTEGRAVLRGRSTALLEIGTGFHPDLTGRENVYLNGAFLGMRKREIDELFDEIVAFSEVEKFIDTQVKFYSNGMSMRLAFAVAVHLKSDILLLDEVIEVADAVFQTKCIEKLKEKQKEGRTVLYVSHQPHNIQRICDRALLIDGGRLVADSKVDKVLERYLS